MIKQITDHVDAGTARLISQFQNKPRLAGLLGSYLSEVQDLEDAAWTVILARMIDNAAGVQLDIIGDIVGEPRRDHDDSIYQRFIKVRILVNRSDGRTATLLHILDVLDPTPRIFNEVPPANIVIEFTQPTTVDPEEILTIMRDAKASGVGLIIIAATDATIDFEHCSVGDASVEAHAYGDANVVDNTYGLLGAAYV